MQLKKNKEGAPRIALTNQDHILLHDIPVCKQCLRATYQQYIQMWF